MTAQASSQNSPPTIAQGDSGYRYSTEPFLLACFSGLRDGMEILDVGTGVGIIPLLLARRAANSRIVAVEIQPELARMAAQNVFSNGLQHRIEIIQSDFSAPIPQLDGRMFDLVVSNPPYRKKKSGRINPDPAKALARHELALDLPTLVTRGSAILRPNGTMVLAYPTERLDEVRSVLAKNGLHPARTRFVFGHSRVASKFFMIEAVKGETPPVPREESPLYMYDRDGNYTPEMNAIYATFDYPGRSHRNRQE